MRQDLFWRVAALLLACRRWFVPVKQQLVQGLNKLSITIKPATVESWALRCVCLAASLPA